jgi:hypothetical protein
MLMWAGGVWMALWVIALFVPPAWPLPLMAEAGVFVVLLPVIVQPCGAFDRQYRWLYVGSLLTVLAVTFIIVQPEIPAIADGGQLSFLPQVVGGLGLLGLGLIAYAPGVKIKPGTPEIARLLDELRDGDAERRAQAAYMLGRTGDLQVVTPLITALRDVEPEVGMEAAYALGMLGDAQALAPLLTAANDPNLLLYKATIWALGQLKDQRAVPTLLQALTNAVPDVRRRAAQALGHLGDEVTLPALGQISQQDPSWEVRRAARNAADEITAQARQAVQAGRDEAATRDQGHVSS